jgi:hypothetical protein
MNAEIVSWDMRIAESNLSDRLRLERTAVINIFQPDPPDERRTRELNALAKKHPFCIYYKAKKHDML